jgi:hypothetical protein
MKHFHGAQFEVAIENTLNDTTGVAGGDCIRFDNCKCKIRH